MGHGLFFGDVDGQRDDFRKEGDRTSIDGAWREIEMIGKSQALKIPDRIAQTRTIKQTVSAFIVFIMSTQFS